MTRIFISHSHADEAIADLLIDFLGEAMEIAKEDIRCTSDPNMGLDFSSSSISDQLKKDLKDAGALIVIVTIDSLRSPWILFEVGSFWTTDKLVAPIIGPGLTFDDLPGPLRGYRSIQIEKENVFYELGELINQLTEKLGVNQIGASRRKDNKLRAFIREFKAWKSQLPATDRAQQQEIEQLEAQIQELKKELSEARSQIEGERSHSNQLEEQRRSLESKIEQLEKDLAERRSQVEQVQNQARSQKEQLEGKIKELEEKRSLMKVVQQDLKSFSFEVLTVNERGEEVNREKKQARYFTEELGNGISLDMIAIPGGKFMMGTEDQEIERLVKKFKWVGYRREKPQHEVMLQPFLMGKYPVTQAQWKEIASWHKVNQDLKAIPFKFKGENRPVEKVSWDDAVEFCQRLSEQTGKRYRLPTEAEWEYACRAGTMTSFHFGETITSDLANYRGDQIYANEPSGEYRQKTTPVGSFSPNIFGLYDMHGNVWEWCQDDWHDNYEGAPKDSRARVLGNISSKVVHGGSWASYPAFSRSAFRCSYTRGNRDYAVGFRVVCVVPSIT